MILNLSFASSFSLKYEQAGNSIRSRRTTKNQEQSRSNKMHAFLGFELKIIPRVSCWSVLERLDRVFQSYMGWDNPELVRNLNSDQRKF